MSDFACGANEHTEVIDSHPSGGELQASCSAPVLRADHVGWPGSTPARLPQSAWPPACHVTSKPAGRIAPMTMALCDRHPGGVIWLTGLSGAGKSSLAVALERELSALGYGCYVLDGDALRTGLNADLGFGPADRSENVRRAGEVAALFADAGLLCITAFISPYAADRDRARTACVARGSAFHEIHVAADLAACEARDPKGLYRRARAGAIAEFTGISAPYEPPPQPELRIDTGSEPFSASLQRLLAHVLQAFALHRPARRAPTRAPHAAAGTGPDSDAPGRPTTAPGPSRGA